MKTLPIVLSAVLGTLLTSEAAMSAPPKHHSSGGGERRVQLGPGNTPPGYVITKPGTAGHNFHHEIVNPAVPANQWHPNMGVRR